MGLFFLPFSIQGPISGGVACLLGIAIIFWLYSIVEIANKRTRDPFDRIVWLLIVLALPVVGSILYLFFSKTETSRSKPPTEEEIKQRANDGNLV